MRVNIYSQELILNSEPGAVEMGSQRSNTGIEYGFVRLLLHSSLKLHHPPMDDDRSAITFWLPKSPSKRLAYLVDQAPAETGLD